MQIEKHPRQTIRTAEVYILTVSVIADIFYTYLILYTVLRRHLPQKTSTSFVDMSGESRCFVMPSHHLQLSQLRSLVRKLFQSQFRCASRCGTERKFYSVSARFVAHIPLPLAPNLRLICTSTMRNFRRNKGLLFL